MVLERPYTVLGPARQTDGYWRHTGALVVASRLELQPPATPPGSDAALILPNGIITTPMLAQGAAQSLLGQYVQALSYSLPTSSVWTETPAQVSGLCSGVRVRIEFAMVLTCPTKGQRVGWSIMIDGAQPLVTLGALDAPEANYLATAVGTYYQTPNPGTHRFSIALYGPSGSSISNQAATVLYVTEQKR